MSGQFFPPSVSTGDELVHRAADIFFLVGRWEQFPVDDLSENNDMHIAGREGSSHEGFPSVSYILQIHVWKVLYRS